jgi:two-component system osmolarity sensor histidine kinase EnvZ
MSGIRNYLPTGLYWRTFLIFAIPVFLLQVAVSVVFFERHWSKMTERLAFAVSGEIAAVIEGIVEYDDKKVLSVMDNNLDL